MSSDINFQPSQILCIEHEGMRLFAEVIQVAEAKPFCWVRPLVLIAPSQVSLPSDSQALDLNGELYDLRQGVDLLLPARLFRLALDVEVIPLLTRLGEVKAQMSSDAIAHQQLQKFTKKLWQEHPDWF